MDFLIIPWNPDPEIFRIGPFAIRWYGLLFASSFLFGYIIMRKIFRNEGLNDALLDKLTITMAIGTIVGARLGHCLFYQPEYYFQHPLEILMVWKGGLASHGAAVGILIALGIFVYKEKKGYFWVLDRIAVVVALAGVFIRMGNLMNSEIYGVETTLPWGFVFLRDHQDAPKHPTQIYEAISYLIVFVLLYKMYWRKKGNIYQGLLISIFLIMVFTSRFFIEYVKEPQVEFEAMMKLNMGQLLSLPFIAMGLVGLWQSLKIKKPGLVIPKK
jgi:prolipoprotein diacylglyceryl transferase